MGMAAPAYTKERFGVSQFLEAQQRLLLETDLPSTSQGYILIDCVKGDC